MLPTTVRFNSSMLHNNGEENILFVMSFPALNVVYTIEELSRFAMKLNQYKNSSFMMFPLFFILECHSIIYLYKLLLVAFQFQEHMKHTCKIKVSNR